jgi:VWFA-related protein
VRVTAPCVVLLCATQVFSQTQLLIKLNVAATDSKGVPVTDLRPADIQVREDGKPQPIVFFRFAGSKREMAQPAPDEYINRPSPPLTLILLDRWNEREVTMAGAWQDIGAAVGHLESIDRVYIYFLANRGELVPVRALPGAEADLRAPQPPTAQALVAKLNDAVRALSGLRDMANMDPVLSADTTLRALGIVSSMAAIAGPKNLIWVTHGFPITVLSLTGQLVDYSGPVIGLAQAAVHAQVAFYTVDQSAQGAGADVAGLSRQTLELVSAQTGGRWYSSGRTSDALAGSAADARASYQIAYYAPVRQGGPKEHKIRLESSRKGIHLLTRASYFGDEAAPDPDRIADDAFTNEIHSPFEAAEIGLRVSVSRKPSALHLDIHVDPSDVFLEHRGDRNQGSLIVKLALYRDGVYDTAPPAFRRSVDLADAALKDGIVIPRDVAVSGETRQIRVMIFDRGIHGLGSVTVPVK